jgi:hypothetical protein
LLIQVGIVGVFGLVLLAGCTDNSANKPSNPTKGTKIDAALAKLNEEDRKLAEAQKWCAVENENRLGNMGVPVKVMLKNQPVFLCCSSCEKRALADPEKTIAKVEELKTKAAASSGK